MTGPAPLVYSLQEEDTGDFRPSVDLGPRWMELPHAMTRSRGLILIPGEEVSTPEFVVDRSHRVHVQAMRGAETVSSDGLDLDIVFRSGSEVHAVGALHVGNEQAASASLAVTLDLAGLEGKRGRLAVSCQPGRDHDPRGDWAAILVFAVAPWDALDLAVARSQSTWRAANEAGRFDGVYGNEIYQDEGGRDTVRRTLEVERMSEPRADKHVSADMFLASLEAIAPGRDERPFRFANRLLDALLPAHIDFAGRLAAIAARLGRPVRMLSLCAGEARIEADMLARTGADAEVTLVDIAPSLLLTAGARFPANARVRLVEASVEAFDPGLDAYDIVAFVSGMHHVVELEKVASNVAKAISTDGEFWLIGEQVGPNGNRLWPEAKALADSLFRQLPEHLRVNRYSGSLDARLPDLDFASSCFEGIRSQDIPLVLARHFMPIAEDRRHCFLWRLIDLAYEANYSLARESDVSILRRLVAEEFAFFANGGIGCELNGVYRNKLAR